MSWPQRKVSSVVDVRLGRQRSPARASGPNMVPYLRAANVTDGQLDLTDVKAMDFDPAEQDIFALRPGDVLVTEGSGSLATVGATAVYCGELPGTVCFQNTLLRLRPKTADLDSAFLAWWAQGAFESGTFATIATGANIHHLGADGVKSLSIPLPPLDAQRRIVDHLGYETQHLLGLARRLGRVKALVYERFEAFVRQTLANLDAPSVPLKRRWRVTDCKHRTPTYVETGYPVVSPGDIEPGRLELSKAHRFVDEADFRELADGPRRPRRGSIVYSRNASVGIAAFVDTDEPFCMGQDVCLIHSTTQDQLYLTYALNTIGLDQLAVEKVGSTFGRINVARIQELRIPCPPVGIQSELAARFDHAAQQTRRLRSALTRQEQLLTERRRALITAAVTGQLDLQEAA